MKDEDAMKLEPGQKVIHRRYGVCIVIEVIMAQGELFVFGVVVKPDNQNGQDLLRTDCRCDIPDMLEDWIMLEERVRNLSIEQPPAEPGEKPIDHEMVWGVPEEDMLPPKPKDHFAPEGEGVPE
jgi:hypothetical protein